MLLSELLALILTYFIYFLYVQIHKVSLYEYKKLRRKYVFITKTQSLR
jgi:uncharacterized membrane protein